MPEKICMYKTGNKHILLKRDRDWFYKKQITRFKKNKQPNMAVEVIQVFLFNSDGQVMIQKRGKNKNHNPGMYDKSLGGHIKFGDSPVHTVLMETIQELQAPSIVLGDSYDFDKAKRVLKDHTKNTAILKPYVVGDFVELPKVINGQVVPIVNKIHLYLGIYDGLTRPADREAAGVLYFSLADLEEGIKERPNDFTGDLKYYFKKYGEDFREFVEYIKGG